MTKHSSVRRQLPPVNVRGAFIRRTDWSGAILRDAVLSEADATGALFRGADFQNAKLVGTVLRGADLREARNLTAQQLSEAVIDDATLLPAGLDREAILRTAR
jgi:uncharacterized protein YjbI with pentapeptide repeats